MIFDYDVAIIGAGAAGIGAARALCATNHSTIILEAASRVGGRAWTDTQRGMSFDLGCSYLHSSERNPWADIAQATGFTVQRREPGWGAQFADLGFTPAERAAAAAAFDAWHARLPAVAAGSDCAAAALDPQSEWNGYIQAVVGYISGAEPHSMSAADYLTYDNAASDMNWRVAEGYGSLVTAALPPAMPLHLSLPVEDIALEGAGAKLTTRAGALRVRTVILTVSTAILAGNSIRLPAALAPWRHAAACLPLGCDEKYFLEITGASPFAPDSHVIGNPRDAQTGSYAIRPNGHPIIECFTGGAGAQTRNDSGPAAGFARAIDELAALFGAQARRHLRPLACSAWSQSGLIGGSYSYATPGQSAARAQLAQPLDERLFFAGEATHPYDFTTAHGAYASGQRAAAEVIAALKRHAPSPRAKPF